jgi:hypothetical protein
MSDHSSIDEIPTDTGDDLDLIVSFANIEKIPIEIRDQYVSVDADPMNMYHRSLFANETIVNETIVNKNTDEAELNGEDYEEYEYEYEYEYFDSDEEIDEIKEIDWEAEERAFWEEFDKKVAEEEKIKEEEEEYQKNKAVIEATTTPSDTRNRQGDATKADYRSSNSLIRSNYHEDDPEISSNIQEVMGGRSGIITSESREPRTIINDLYPSLDIDGWRPRPYWRSSNGVGDANFYKLLETLEEHAVSKVEHKKYDHYRPRKIIKYKVPILRWDDVIHGRNDKYYKPDKKDRERQNRQRQYEEDAGKGIYRAHTRVVSSEYIGYNGQRSMRNETIIERVTRVGAFHEAVIPKGICPIDFRVDYSSSTHQKPGAKINRTTAFDVETQTMIDIGSAVDRTGHWKPHTNSDKEHLIVDLGQNTRVTHISTMGSPPPVTTFPGGNYSYNYNTKFADDYDGPDPQRKNMIYVLYRSSGRYSGGTYLQDYRPNQDGKWVESYELFARPDHGKWMRIGVYTGNSDPFSEVIHDVRRDLNDIKFRYLKFVPKSYHNHVAMKVDIFGLATEAETTSTIDRTHLIYTVDLPVRIGTKNGTELVRKHRVGYRDYYGSKKAEYLERRTRHHFLKSELKAYRDNKEAYLDMHSPPLRDLHAIKYNLNREEQEIREAIYRSLKNRKRRRAYRQRVRHRD